MGKLNARKVQVIREPGMYGDGEGLYLRVGPSGSKSWILRTVVHGRRRDLGIGSASLLPLAEARETARELRKIARQGGDPDTVRKRERLTFEQAASRVYQNLRPTWKNAKHAQTWISTIENYANPQFGPRPIDSITSADILKVLGPIWIEKHETAKRLKQRLGTIFDWAKSAGHYPHENPVNGLKKALPSVKRQVTHLPSLPWPSLPAFMQDLAERDAVTARALEFLILTAARSGEARGARWSEIEAGVWTIPAERMKRGKEHRVPLSEEAQAVLERVRGLDTDFVFPSRNRPRSGELGPLSDQALKQLLRRMGHDDFVPHGFRSTFRDWCSESAHADREVAEAALSHVIGNEVERAYARSDLFERRRTLMGAWGRFATGKSQTVVQMECA